MGKNDNEYFFLLFRICVLHIDSRFKTYLQYSDPSTKYLNFVHAHLYITTFSFNVAI